MASVTELKHGVKFNTWFRFRRFPSSSL